MDTDFTQVRALLMEVKPYVLLLIVFIGDSTEYICLPRDGNSEYEIVY